MEKKMYHVEAHHSIKFDSDSPFSLNWILTDLYFDRFLKSDFNQGLDYTENFIDFLMCDPTLSVYEYRGNDRCTMYVTDLHEIILARH